MKRLAGDTKQDLLGTERAEYLEQYSPTPASGNRMNAIKGLVWPGLGFGPSSEPPAEPQPEEVSPLRSKLGGWFL